MEVHFSQVPIVGRHAAIRLITALCLCGLFSSAGKGQSACSQDVGDVSSLLGSIQTQQQQASEQRTRWNFDQHIMVRLLRSKGRLAREELRHYRVQPTAETLTRDLVSVQGKVVIKGTEYPYDDPEYRSGDIDLDGELVESFAEDVLFHQNDKDGIGDSMYPLSAKMMDRHRFTLHGSEGYRDRQVYRLTFQPLSKRDSADGEAGIWEGEVLVDCATLAPVLVTTHQARKVPFVVRTMLGSNVQQVGFKLEYAQMTDGEWFPLRYSGEFSLRVLFGYSRRIALSVRNENFERASADDVIRYHLDEDALPPGSSVMETSDLPEAERQPQP